MPKPRGRSHTTLTETATIVVRELQKYDGVKMIAPGIIDGRRAGKRFITVVYTTAGFRLIISGGGVQKLSVHLTDQTTARRLIESLKTQKALAGFSWNER